MLLLLGVSNLLIGRLLLLLLLIVVYKRDDGATRMVLPYYTLIYVPVPTI